MRAPRLRRPCRAPIGLGLTVGALGLCSVGLSACAPERSCETELYWVEPARRVSVRGDWSGGEDEALHRGEDGVWRITLDLPEGDHTYLFRVDGQDERDPFAPLLSWDAEAGREVSRVRVGDCQQPALRVQSLEPTADGELRVEATFLRGKGGARLDGATATLEDGASLSVEIDPGDGALSVRGSGLSTGKHRLSLRGWGRDGAEATASLPFWVEDSPFAWEDALIYQVLIDRFAGPSGALPPGQDPGLRQGGTIAGLLQKLDEGYFEALGVRVLWISPLYRNAEGQWPGDDGHLYEAYHGYWPVSSREVEPAFGGEAEVRALVEAAHAAGLRVIMDLVPNHVHEAHPWVAEHTDDGWFHADPDCICGDYDCPWSEDIEVCWFTPYLPDLNWEEPAVERAAVADAIWWAESFDLDGLRIDAVPMMSRPAVRALVYGLSESLEAGPTRFFTLGETFTGEGGAADIQKNLGPFGLDGQFEFPLLWALRGWLAWQTIDAAELNAVLDESEAAWAGSGSVMAPFVGNHDTSRFLSEAAGDGGGDPWASPPPQPDDAEPYERLLLAQAVVLSLPGAPVLYQGDEYGLAGATDPDSRRPMVFGPGLSALQSWTLERVGRLGRARACSEALRRGGRQTLLAEGGSLALLRDAGDGEPALLLVNADDTPAFVSLTLPEDTAVEDPWFTELLEGDPAVPFTPGEPTSLWLPPRSARLFLSDRSARCAEDL